MVAIIIGVILIIPFFPFKNYYVKAKLKDQVRPWLMS